VGGLRMPDSPAEVEEQPLAVFGEQDFRGRHYL
jgi:hypothetical protein